MPYSAPGPFLGAQTASAYQVSRSLRFRSSASAYLSRTFGTPTNQKKWTLSAWAKLSPATGAPAIFGVSPSATNYTLLGFSSNVMHLDYYNGSQIFNVNSNGVFRDYSAWYHLIYVFDSDNATSTDRVIFYVNGVRQSVTFSTAVSSGATCHINTSGQSLNIGSLGPSYTTNYYLDGYLAEVNFIDGQALTPSSFGQSNALTGVWEPKQYTGTYGSNGFYLPFSLNTTSTYAGSFNGTSKYLTTPTSSNLALGSGDFTIEGWFNQTTQNNTGIVCQDYLNGIDIRTDESGASRLGFYAGSGTFVYGTFSGAGQWHHFAVVRNGSGSNNLKLYLDGLLLTQTTNTTNFTGNQFRIGAVLTGGTTATSLTGSISNVRVVKGTAVYTAPFTPSSTALTAITNTQLLTLQDATIIDNSANNFTLTNTGTVTTSTDTPFVSNITSDASGQNNGWASNNINYTSSGTTYDSMIDSPTNYADGGNGRGNYAVLNPLIKTDSGSANTMSEGNLRVNCTSNSYGDTSFSSIFVSSGKWYAEFTLSNSSYPSIEIFNMNYPLNFGSSGNGRASLSPYGYGYLYDGNKQNNSSPSAYGSALAVGDVIGVALDMDNGKVWFSKNGTWQASGDPAAGTNAAFTSLSGNFAIGICDSQTVSYSRANFGQRPFTYTPPSGFSALNTQNLPAPALTPSP